MLDQPIVVVLAGLGAVIVVVVLIILSRYKVAGPNQAILVTGSGSRKRGDEPRKAIVGGGAFAFPVIQKLTMLDLSSRRIDVRVQSVANVQGLSLDVEAVAIVKIGSTAELLQEAAERYAEAGNEAMEQDVQEVLAAALRDIVGQMTVEEIIKDRDGFAAQARRSAEQVLTAQGLMLDTFMVQNVSDNSNYILNLGRPEQARVWQEAQVAEAEAKQISEQRRIEAEQRVIDAQREYDLREAAIKSETEAAAAKAAAAGPLEKAAQDQKVLEQEQLVAVRQAELTDRELDTKIRKPADAARYAAEQVAEAARIEAVKRAEADKTRIELAADADKTRIELAAEATAKENELIGSGERSKRSSLADAEAIEGHKAAEAIEARGLAEALVVEKKGIAEATAIEEKAKAFEKYNEAAMAELIVNMLPELAGKIAEPMAAIDDLTIVSNDGASALSKTVTGNMTDLDRTLEPLLGFSLSSLLQRFQNGETLDQTRLD